MTPLCVPILLGHFMFLLRSLKAVCCGIGFCLLLTLSTPACALWIYLYAPWRLWGTPKTRGWALTKMEAGANTWMRLMQGYIRTFHPTRWICHFPQDILEHKNQGLFLISNHQSWVDIFVFIEVLGNKIPLFRFLLKRNLIFIPFFGFACYLLNCPFMRRYNKAQILKNPALAKRDLQTIERNCSRLREGPITLFNFTEGTRFTAAKHKKQSSPYLHLLKPKTGGLIQSFKTMPQYFTHILDMTIYFPGKVPTFWDFMCGKVPTVYIHGRILPVPDFLQHPGHYTDEALKELTQDWIGKVWQHKDATLTRLIQEHQGHVVSFADTHESRYTDPIASQSVDPHA